MNACNEGDVTPSRDTILTARGLSVYLTDWMPPTSADTWRGLDAYVNQDLVRAVQCIQKREEIDQVTLLGYCLGGLFGAVYTVLHSHTVKQYIALALPLEGRDMSL